MILELNGNAGSYCTTVTAAFQIRNDKTITKMDLRRKNIDDNDIKFVSEALHNNETITDLDLSQNKIGNTGAQHLAEALQNNKSSSMLTNHYGGQRNRTGVEGAKYFADALKTNK
ncbi:unnamed protein product, partial [Adineta steineri]